MSRWVSFCRSGRRPKDRAKKRGPRPEDRGVLGNVFWGFVAVLLPGGFALVPVCFCPALAVFVWGLPRRLPCPGFWGPLLFFFLSCGSHPEDRQCR